MTKGLIGALLFFCGCLPLLAQEVDFAGGGPAADLRCPAPLRSKRPHGRPARPSRPAQALAPMAAEEALEPPDRTELAEVLPSETVAGDKSILLKDLPPLSRPPRIGIWGDSHLAAHFFQDELLRMAGMDRSRVRAGFLPPTLGRPGVRLPIRKVCQGGGWAYQYAYTAPAGPLAVARGLARMGSRSAGAFLWVDFRASPADVPLKGVDVLLAPRAADAMSVRLAVAVDDEPEQVVTLDAADGGLKIRAAKAFSVIRLRLVEGSLTLEGLKPDYASAPAVLMDTLAIPGATVRGWANADPADSGGRLGGDDYDMVILEYGTNEGNQRPFNEQTYGADLRTALAHLRHVFPSAQCLLIGPTDRGVLVRHAKVRRGKKKVKRVPPPTKADLLRFSRIHQQIGEIQRQLAAEAGCGFWSWQDAMGGPGGAYRWLYQSPRLMANDLTHLTVPGYQLSAQEFSGATGFAQWLTTIAR